MNTTVDALIASEQAKIDLLRDKIKVCEQRIALLRSIQSGDDDIDAALAKRVGAQPEKQSNEANQEKQQRVRAFFAVQVGASDQLPKKTLSDSTIKLLRFAGATDKSTSQFLDFATRNDIDKNRQAMRAFLHQYKTTYKLLTSERDGHFRLSELGVKYLASLDAAKGGSTSAT